MTRDEIKTVALGLAPTDRAALEACLALDAAEQHALLLELRAHPAPVRETTTTPTPPTHHGSATNYTYVAQHERETVQARYGDATRETILDDLLALRIATYAISAVLSAIDFEGHPRYGSVGFRSHLMPYEDGHGNYWDRNNRAIEGPLLNWINAGDVATDACVTWNGQCLSDSVVILTASGSDLYSGVFHGAITAFDVRNLEATLHGKPRVTLDGVCDAPFIAPPITK